MIDQWEHANPQVRRGRPFTYSDLAIETLLALRELFRLPYRQTEGLGRALAKLMRVDIPTPHHTSLVKRAGKLNISISLTKVQGSVDVVVDSTRLKVYDEGEWKVRQHGIDQRRTWRKVHLAVDPDSHTILAQLLTDSRTHDGTAALPLLDQVDASLDTFYGDGAYDQRQVYDALEKRPAWVIITKLLNGFVTLAMPLSLWIQEARPDYHTNAFGFFAGVGGHFPGGAGSPGQQQCWRSTLAICNGNLNTGIFQRKDSGARCYMILR